MELKNEETSLRVAIVSSRNSKISTCGYNHSKFRVMTSGACNCVFNAEM